MSVLLRVAYDGSGFHGFARQADGPRGPIRTVQGELEAALAQLYGETVLSRGASRTDAGVHAQGQLVSLEPPRAIPCRGVARALAGLLPPDLTVVAAWEQHGPDGGPVDVRRGNEGKHYRYRIRCTYARDPLAAGREWPLLRRLSLAPMQRAAAGFVGTHDFAGFRAAACQAATTERTIEEVTVRGLRDPVGPLDDPGRLDPEPSPSDDPDVIEIDVWGTAFLYNMVRIMVGTLVEVGRGRREPESIAELLARPDRRRSGATAPAQGLTLVQVRWPRVPPTPSAEPAPRP